MGRLINAKSTTGTSDFSLYYNSLVVEKEISIQSNENYSTSLK